MKEELLRILNIKLDDINLNIESLSDLNDKIAHAEANLSYMKRMLDKFSENGKYDVLNFTNFSREEFDDLLTVVRSDVRDIFKTKNCNYDGLVYLINGINNGVSLSLTIEQENAINYLISEMEDVLRSDMAAVDGLDLVKMRFTISDIDVLYDYRKKYENIIDKLSNQEYLDEVDDIKEAMEFNKLDASLMNKIYVYLLKYNADIYDRNKDTISNTYDDAETRIPLQEEKVYEEDHENFGNEINEEERENETDDVEFHLPEFNKIDDEDNIVIPTIYDEPFAPEIETDKEEVNDNYDNISFDDNKDSVVENNDSISLDDEEKDVDADFKDIVPEEDYEEYKPLDETISMSPISNKTSTREVQRLFQEFDIQIDDSELNKYLDGNIDEYQKIIKVLKDNGILSNVTNNELLFREILVGSHADDVINALNIVKEDLSVDNEDYETTLSIVINTIPSIFVRTGGNYDNFVENVKLFKELGINLINLFDFSKEVLVANHDSILANYEIVKEYGINIDDKNAKYFLLLDDIAKKMDYYVESVYKDDSKKEIFDGYKFIKDYPNKLNVVTDETIKRLRYSSENGKKVFGSKPNSLTGEITNLKVNVLDISDEYMDEFFDNNFDDITKEEVRQYAKLCKSSSNVGDYTDELSVIEKYHSDLRYDINGIRVSYNKVVRNYNILRSLGIDRDKALEFAVCYNLVITKDEYLNIKNVLKEGDDE